MEQLEFIATFIGTGPCNECEIWFDDLMAYHGLPNTPALCDACAAKAGIPMKGYPAPH